MPKLPLLREAILPRLDGIPKDLRKLRELSALGLAEFEKQGDTLSLAQHHLRLALEGVFHIGAHILSRMEGGRSREYAEIAARLGELGVVPTEFAKKKLVPMARMRNLLTHFYAEINISRLYRVLQEHLGDIEEFLRGVKNVMEHPDQFDLTIE